MRHDGSLRSDHTGGPQSGKQPKMSADGAPAGSAVVHDQFTEERPNMAVAGEPTSYAAERDHFNIIEENYQIFKKTNVF